MRLNTPGLFNKIGKTVTPALGTACYFLSLANIVELISSYLNCIIGKGSGSGWDKGEELAASRLIHGESPIILDIGANRGAWSTEVRRIIGNDGTWLMIDPASECCAILRSLGFGEVIEAAVSDREGTATLYSPSNASPIASLHERHDSVAAGRPQEHIDVAVKTIDGILDQRKIQIVDMAKMDLEGHELFALRGATRSLESHRLRCVTFEFGSANVNSRTFFRDFWDILNRYDYDIFRILPGGRTIRILEYYEDLEYFRGVSNYIAVARKAFP